MEYYKSQNRSAYSRDPRGKKKELIQKHIEMLMEFDEDRLDIAEVLLEILNGMSRVEGIWLMNLVSTAMQLPDILFKEWLEKADHRELFSALRWFKLFGDQYLGFWMLGLVLFAIQEIPYMLMPLFRLETNPIKQAIRRHVRI